MNLCFLEKVNCDCLLLIFCFRIWCFFIYWGFFLGVLGNKGIWLFMLREERVFLGFIWGKKEYFYN